MPGTPDATGWGLFFDLLAGRQALREVTPRTIELIGSLTDAGVPMPGSEWTVGEAAAHVVFGAQLYAEYAQGVEPDLIDRKDLTESHRRRMAQLMDRDVRQLGADLQLSIDTFLDATEGRAAGDLLPWHLGRQPCGTLMGLLLGEQLLHGYDIAQTVSAEWPIGDEPARFTIQALLSILSMFVDSEAASGVDTTYELAIDGGPRVLARFHDGTVNIGPPEDMAIDCRLSGDPVAWLLALYGRVSWEQTLRAGGVMVADGDAALGGAFKQLVRNP